jgi:hypothetical protein
VYGPPGFTVTVFFKIIRGKLVLRGLNKRIMSETAIKNILLHWYLYQNLLQSPFDNEEKKRGFEKKIW